jgi:hypothetical protein
MKTRLIRACALLAALSLSALAVQAQSGWYKEGCWSPYPNCVGAKDVFVDPAGVHWQCGACGTTKNPSPTTGYQSSNLHSIGYWCPRASS